ncbi:MAG: hypothetical protein V2A79_19825 [Planctomycetota bacterium]
MKLTTETTQRLINAALTIVLILISLAGYTVTVLDPAKVIIVQKVEANTAAMAKVSDLLIAQGAQPRAEVAGSGIATHLSVLEIAVPTALPTATPAFLVSARNVGNAIEVRNKNETPVFQVNASGNITYSGITSIGGLQTQAGAFRAPTDVATATPAFFVDSAGGLSNVFEVRYSETPVVSVSKLGNTNITGGVYIAVPTSLATATPALMVNSAGALGNLLSLRQASTPVVQISAAGLGTWSGIQTFNNAAVVSAPTAVGTATPALLVDTAGVSNIASFRKNATPVLQVSGGGNVTAAGFLSIGTLVRVTAAGALTCAVTTNLTPTGTYQPITAAAACSPLGIVAGTAGDLLVLTNTSANTITITDTGVIMLGATRAVTQYDSLFLLSDGTNWLEIAFVAN